MYEWDSKEAICRQLYVEENKSLDEVMAVLKEDGFAPSKRAFQMQFRRWNFPLKYSPLSNDEELRIRIKELWENNTRQKDMLVILEEEGYGIKERDLMRIRAKNGWLLRESNGSNDSKVAKRKEMDWQEHAMNDDEDDCGQLRRELEEAIEQANQPPLQGDVDYRKLSNPKRAVIETPEQAQRRQQRLAELQVLSEEKWEAGKRRRRTRGYAGLGPDPAGPPRFPSETTIDESKVVLQFTDNKLYRKLRDDFQAICEELGIRKKTDVGPESWQAAKDRLVAQSPHLQGVLYENDDINDSLERKQLCLDIICLDVTKRIRTIGTKMTLPEARNVLNLNPEQTRRARGIFYAMLKNDNFISKVLTGEERWNQLKAEWITESDVLRDLFSDGDLSGIKGKALEVLARDIMKRLRDDSTKSQGKPKATGGPSGGPGPAPPRYEKHSGRLMGPSIAERTAAMALAATAGDGLDALPAASELQIDPTLLLAAEHIHDQTTSTNSKKDTTHGADQQSSVPTALPTTDSQLLQEVDMSIHARHNHNVPISSAQVLFQLVSTPSVPDPPKPDWWMDVLQPCTMSELQNKITEKHPNAVILQIGGEDEDNRVTITNDATLRAYLTRVEVGRARLSVGVDFP